jgi:type IV secretory pathway VirB9-like protein
VTSTPPSSMRIAFVLASLLSYSAFAQTTAPASPAPPAVQAPRVTSYSESKAVAGLRESKASSTSAPVQAQQVPLTPVSATVSASQQDPFGPIPSPHESTNVVFTYDANKIYNLFTQAGQFIQIVFGQNEEIVTVQASDTARWQSKIVEDQEAAPRYFLKPIQTGLVNTISIVTMARIPNGAPIERTYDLRVESTPEGGKRYQRVSFRYPDDVERKALRQRRIIEAEEMEVARLNKPVVADALDLQSLNTNYEIKGRGGFRPTAVLDNGTFTVFLMPSGAEWPALFMGERNKASLVVPVKLANGAMKVDRVADAWTLRIGNDEVTVTKKAR